LLEKPQASAWGECHIPSKNAFLVGPATLTRPSSKPIENLRPNHIAEALFWPELTADKNVLFEQSDFELGRYYILTLLREGDGGRLEIARKIWYDRVDLRVCRVQLFGTGGVLNSDIGYSDWQAAGTTLTAGNAHLAARSNYARDIKIWRPQDDYKLEIHIFKLTLNEPIPADRFALAQPGMTNLVNLGEKTSGIQQ
jgi:hypothetical protein